MVTCCLRQNRRPPPVNPEKWETCCQPRERERKGRGREKETHLGVFLSFFSNIFGDKFMPSVCDWGSTHKHMCEVLLAATTGDLVCPGCVDVCAGSPTFPHPAELQLKGFVLYLVVDYVYSNTHTYRVGVNNVDFLVKYKFIHTHHIQMWSKIGDKSTHILATSLTSSLHVISFIWHTHKHTQLYKKIPATCPEVTCLSQTRWLFDVNNGIRFVMMCGFDSVSSVSHVCRCAAVAPQCLEEILLTKFSWASIS